LPVDSPLSVQTTLSPAEDWLKRMPCGVVVELGYFEYVTIIRPSTFDLYWAQTFSVAIPGSKFIGKYHFYRQRWRAKKIPMFRFTIHALQQLLF
jgi:hypothetical protein